MAFAQMPISSVSMQSGYTVRTPWSTCRRPRETMARPPSFREIEAFAAVMQAGTATGAALMLSTTQPSISRRLAELQNATDLRLFELTHGRLRPTAEGRLLYGAVRRHLLGLEKIAAVAALLRKAGAGTLRIGCTPTLGVGLLPALIDRCLSRFPDARFDVRTLGTPQLAEHLRQELVDLVLTTGTLDPAEFRPRVVARSRVVCVMPKGHALSHARRIRPTLLQGMRVMTLSDSEPSTLLLRKLCKDADPDRQFVVETNSSITICALVAAGNGVGLVNPYVASTFASQLVVRPFEPAIEIAVEMAMPEQTAPSMLARHFVATLTEYVTALRRS